LVVGAASASGNLIPSRSMSRKWFMIPMRPLALAPDGRSMVHSGKFLSVVS
jgi:hypothetical protein